MRMIVDQPIVGVSMRVFALGHRIVMMRVMPVIVVMRVIVFDGLVNVSVGVVLGEV